MSYGVAPVSVQCRIASKSPVPLAAHHESESGVSTVASTPIALTDSAMRLMPVT